jgi:hypothetical protein
MQLLHVGQRHNPHSHLFCDRHKRSLRRRFDNSWIMASYISRSEYVPLCFGGHCRKEMMLQFRILIFYTTKEF